MPEHGNRWPWSKSLSAGSRYLMVYRQVSATGETGQTAYWRARAPLL
jgi:hypothetical protein